ncbi:aldehyde dehydrogenase family protein, partial [Thermodesulfobacteriota bacterium]
TGLDGVFFTGSAETGKAIHRAFAGHPEKILALEMGGNNPLLVFDVADLDAAAYLTILSAYITSGQRCSCARRLIVPNGRDWERFIDRLAAMVRKIRVGVYTDTPEPFMGPVISDEAADELLSVQDGFIADGARTLIRMEPLRGIEALLSPGLIDVTDIQHREDVELFGPLLQLIRVEDFDEALKEANDTAYGLAAGLLSDNADLYDRFRRKIKTGVVNWNRHTTGASSAMPFGGIGLSGNHRPSAYFAADYCAYPVASIETDALEKPEATLPGIDLEP